MYMLPKFYGHFSYGNGDINSYINSYMNTLKIRCGFSKSKLLIYNPKVPDKADRKTTKSQRRLSVCLLNLQIIQKAMKNTKPCD